MKKFTIEGNQTVVGELVEETTLLYLVQSQDDLHPLEKRYTTIEELPTYDYPCKHTYINLAEGEKQTLVIEVSKGKYLTVCVIPDSDNVDVKMHGHHKFQDFGETKAFYDMSGAYSQVR